MGRAEITTPSDGFGCLTGPSSATSPTWSLPVPDPHRRAPRNHHCASRLSDVDLPVMPPIRPMLAKTTTLEKALAMLPDVQLEPKWDGFRCIVFRDGDEIELTSRNTKPLTRYFPDVVEALRGVAARAVRPRRRAGRGDR